MHRQIYRNYHNPKLAVDHFDFKHFHILSFDLNFFFETRAIVHSSPDSRIYSCLFIAFVRIIIDQLE